MTPDLMEDGAAPGRLAAKRPRRRQQRRPQRRLRPRGAIGEPDFAHGVALYLDEISVSFDGFKALNKLSLTINVGELRCIIGPNGAGKTTMMDCITGKTRPDSGTCFFGSTIDLLRLSETDIAQVGVGRKFQKPTVYEQLSVFENLELALRRPPRARLAVQPPDGRRSSTASARC
jgi:urea transport system ATP-binding protein